MESDPDPIDNLDPLCSWKWKSGHQKACTFYDFENCKNPTWPTSCPVLSVTASSGCVKYWCPEQEPGQVEFSSSTTTSSTSTTTSSTSTTTDTSIIEPGSGFDYPFDLSFPGTYVPLIVVGTLILLSVVGIVVGCIWKRLLRQKQRDNFIELLLELGRFFKRLFWIFLPCIVCALFPLIVLCYGLYRACRTLYSHCILDKRKRSADWEAPVAMTPQAPSQEMQMFSGFHTTISGTPSASVPNNPTPGQVRTGDEVAILLPEAPQQPPDRSLSLKSQVSWNGQVFLAFETCWKWCSECCRWLSGASAATSASTSAAALQDSNILWSSTSRNGTLPGPSSNPNPTGEPLASSPPGIPSASNHSGEPSAPSTSPSSHPGNPSAGPRDPDLTPPASPQGPSYHETTHRYKSKFARKLFGQNEDTLEDDFSFDIVNAVQSTRTSSFFDEGSSRSEEGNSRFETAPDQTSSQSSSSGYTAMHVTSRFNALIGHPTSSNNLTGRLEEMVERFKTRSQSSASLSSDRTTSGPPPTPRAKPDFRDLFRDEFVIPPIRPNPVPPGRVLSTMNTIKSGVIGKA